MPETRVNVLTCSECGTGHYRRSHRYLGICEHCNTEIALSDLEVDAESWAHYFTQIPGRQWAEVLHIVEADPVTADPEEPGHVTPEEYAAHAEYLDLVRAALEYEGISGWDYENTGGYNMALVAYVSNDRALVVTSDGAAYLLGDLPYGAWVNGPETSADEAALEAGVSDVLDLDSLMSRIHEVQNTL